MKTLENIVQLLNKLLNHDPELVNTLFSYKVPVNKWVQESEQFIVGSYPNKAEFNQIQYKMGVLGILNSVCSEQTEIGHRRIAAEIDEGTDKIIRFIIINK